MTARFKKRKRPWPELLGLPPDTPRDVWDYIVIDERGHEVWAKDLAERYRQELRERGRRNYKDVRQMGNPKRRAKLLPREVLEDPVEWAKTLH